MQEKLKNWKLRRQKPRKISSENHSFEVESAQMKLISSENEYPPSTMVKSRSLESLRDAIHSSQEDLLTVADQPEEVGRKKLVLCRGAIIKLYLLHKMCFYHLLL